MGAVDAWEPRFTRVKLDGADDNAAPSPLYRGRTMAIGAARAQESTGERTASPEAEVRLTPETALQLAPGVRTRFNAAGHVLLDAPDGTIVDLGPRGYAILSLFAQPLALGEAIERLGREAPATDFAPTMNVVNMLIEEGALARPGPGRAAASGWADPVEHARMLHDDRRTGDYLAAIAAAVRPGDVVLGVLQALVIAVALSILDVVRRSAQPQDAVLGWVDRLGRWGNVELHPSALITPGVVGYRLDDRLFFANARYVKGRVREAIRGAPDKPRWLVFDAEAMAHVDATGLEALRELALGLPRDGVALVVARMKPQVYERLVAGGVVEEIGEERFFPTVRAAVAACLELDAARVRSPA